jgi:hypothetical protein
LVVPKTYPSVGHCIYCGALVADKRDPSAKFGDEHIIPLAFGGCLLLREASCRDCEKITSGIETHCIEQMVRNTREHLGLHARRHKRSRRHLPVNIVHDTHEETLRVPLPEHPALLMMFDFDPPGLFLDTPITEGPFVGRWVARSITADLRKRLDRIGRTVNFVQRDGFIAAIFGRMLAKIAHSYAIAELGIGGFKPLLNDLILERPPLHEAQFVGGCLIPEPPTTERYEIGLKISYRLDGRGFWVVRVRLFADLDMPVYYVVAGEPLG